MGLLGSLLPMACGAAGQCFGIPFPVGTAAGTVANKVINGAPQPVPEAGGNPPPVTYAQNTENVGGRPNSSLSTSKRQDDVNGDGIVNAADYNLEQQYSMVA